MARIPYLMDHDLAAINGLKLTAPQQEAVGFLADYANQMVILALSEQRTTASASKMIREVYQVSDTVMNGCLKNGKKLACKEGCDWCCYLRVKVTPLEVLCIAEYLYSVQNADGLAALQERLAADLVPPGMDGSKRVPHKKSCLLLSQNRCMAYPVRPVACRIYHAVNALDCEATLDNLDRSVTIRRDISALGLGVFAGLTEGLCTVGLQTRLLELNAGLQIILNEPGIANRWLDGEPVFGEAETPNAREIDSTQQQ